CWVEAVELAVSAPLAGAGVDAGPITELSRLMREDVIQTHAYREELRETLADVLRQLPKEARSLLVGDEAAEEVLLSDLALEGSDAFVGPLVLPGEGPCYLCWRMRALACADDFGVAMAREEARDRARTAGTAPPLLPGLGALVAGVVTQEAVALLVGAGQVRLPGHVLQIEGLERRQTRHPVLQRPDCPACRKKGLPQPADLSTLAELVAQPARTTDFDAIEAAVVSPLCGVVRALDEVPKDPSEPARPHIVRAELANARFATGPDAFVTCSGKGMDLRRARDLALGEALERYSSLAWPAPGARRARRGDLPGASLDPHELVLFADHQYDALPFARYREDSELEWVTARSLVSGEAVWVPRLAAHLGHEVSHHAGYLFPATSNGFAAGATLADAVCAGLLEVIERDAFLIAWAHRLVTPRLDARTVPDATAAQVAALYHRRGVGIEVHLLPTDSAASVAIALGWSAELPAVVVGLGAALDAVTAARKAVLEVAQVRPALHLRLQRDQVRERMASLVADPATVAELDDHDLLYADPETAAQGLAFWREGELRDWAGSVPEQQPVDLAGLVGSLAAVSPDVLYVDVTTDDVAQLGVRVARGIVPGFQPIHFGAGQFRLGHPRLRTMPYRLGLRPRPADLEELNLAPHPVA
ncbi:MAG: TOMM precursor leader peptide-binding protein, partial [Propionicimonas sp.]